MMVVKGGIKVDQRLTQLVEKEIAPGTGVDPEQFWQAFGKIVIENAPRNKELLDKRDKIQKQIDDYHMGRKPINMPEYKKFLQDIDPYSN